MCKEFDPYSEIAFCMTDKIYNLLISELNNCTDKDIESEIKLLLEVQNTYTFNSDSHCYYYESINWKSDDKSVKWFYQFLNNYKKEVLFIRCGDTNWYDFEIIGEYFDNPFDLKLEKPYINFS